MEHSDTNRMHVDNLATVFAPCLISRTPPDVMRMSDESLVVQQLLRSAATVVVLERVGAVPRDTGDTSSVFVGVRLLHNPSFSSSPVLSRNSPSSLAPLSLPSSPAGGAPGGPLSPLSSSKRQILAYAKYDYRGSQASETLTLARGEAVTIVELPSDSGGRWCRCALRESGEEGWVPTSFLDCPVLARTPLGRERALSRAGNSGNALPAASPLRNSVTVSLRPSETPSTPMRVGSQSTAAGPARTLEEMSDRMDILSRALIREKEERMQLERRLEALLSKK